MNAQYGRQLRRGTKHLRVAIEISDRGAAVTSLWVVDQPLVQQRELYKPILVRVDVGGATVYVDAVDDPRATRGLYREQLGHSYGRTPSGTLQASIPFDSPGELLNAQISIADVSEAVKSTHDPDVLAGLLDQPQAAVKTIGVVAAPQLTTHRDWDRAAGVLGLPRSVHRYEIYRGEDGVRWRLVRADGAVIAESGKSYRDRQACEEDLRWTRTHAPSAQVVSLDLPTPE